MNQLFEKSKRVVEAQQSQKGYHIIVEILFFFLIYIIFTCAESAFLLPYMFVKLYRNQEYIQAAQALDQEKLTQITADITSSTSMNIMSLYCTLGMILATVIFCRIIQKRKASSLGFIKSNMWKDYLKGILFGFCMFTLGIAVCLITGAVKLSFDASKISFGMLVLILIGFLIQGMAEEVLMRGFFLVSVARRYPLIVAILLNSVGFALLHYSNPGFGVLSFINLSLFGVFASLYFIKKGSIWGVAAFHSIWNFIQGNFYGIKVSGLDFQCSIFQATTDPSKSILNGGDFGLEGGIGVTIVMLLGIVLIMTKMKQQEVWTEEEQPQLEQTQLGA